MRPTLRWAQWILLASGVALLAYCGLVLMDTHRFQNREGRQLEHLVRDRPAANGVPSAASDGLIGRIAIPRLGVSAIVMEGSDEATLRHAVGHIAGTALPGQPGNVGIAGHRDTFFRPLRNIRKSDMITFATPAGESRYRVVSTRVVGPRDLGVLGNTAEDVLTLVTCYPFYFVGSAPSRFIVRADRVR